MKLTPLEIRKHEFARSFRGYDAEEVDAFLSMVAQHWQTMSQDLQRLEDRLEEQTQRVNHYLKVEEAMEHALENARSLSKDKLDSAEQEAGERMKRAEEEATRRLDDSQRRAQTTLREATERSAEVTRQSDYRLAQVTRQAEDAMNAAVKDLAAIDSDRRRMLERFQQFLASGIDGLRQYDLSEPGPAVTAFTGAMQTWDEKASDTPPVSSTSDSTPVAITQLQPDPAPREQLESEIAQPPEAVEVPATETWSPDESVTDESVPEEPNLDESDAPTPSFDDSIESESISAPEATLLAPEDPAPQSSMPAEAAQAEPPSDSDSTSPPDSDRATSPDPIFDNLPSAEDGFEEPEVTVSDTPRPKPIQDPQEFGADDEIRKIRRILEDLDS